MKLEAFNIGDEVEYKGRSAVVADELLDGNIQLSVMLVFASGEEVWIPV